MNSAIDIVFVFENQFVQHELLRKHLGYPVFPDSNDSYILLMNYVRIFLNPGYGDYHRGNVGRVGQNLTIREKAFYYILEKIGEVKPAAIIMDHILVGNHSSEDGIFLANELQESGNVTQPIIFLSRTNFSEFKVMANFPKLREPKDWLNKGYAGKKFGDLQYITEIVTKKLAELITLHKSNIRKTSHIKKDELVHRLGEVFGSKYIGVLKSKRIVYELDYADSMIEIEMIEEFLSKENFIGSEIKMLLNKLSNQ